MSNNWEQEELKASLLSYFEMITKEYYKIPYKKVNYYRTLSTVFGRTTKSYEFRMQNISYVLQRTNQRWINGLKPARNVGANVENILAELIRDLLKSGWTKRSAKQQIFTDKSIWTCIYREIDELLEKFLQAKSFLPVESLSKLSNPTLQLIKSSILNVSTKRKSKEHSTSNLFLKYLVNLKKELYLLYHSESKLNELNIQTYPDILKLISILSEIIVFCSYKNYSKVDESIYSLWEFKQANTIPIMIMKKEMKPIKKKIENKPLLTNIPSLKVKKYPGEKNRSSNTLKQKQEMADAIYKVLQRINESVYYVRLYIEVINDPSNKFDSKTELSLVPNALAEEMARGNSRFAFTKSAGFWALNKEISKKERTKKMGALRAFTLKERVYSGEKNRLANALERKYEMANVAYNILKKYPYGMHYVTLYKRIVTDKSNDFDSSTKLSLLSNALLEEVANANPRFIFKGKGIGVVRPSKQGVLVYPGEKNKLADLLERKHAIANAAFIILKKYPNGIHYVALYTKIVTDNSNNIDSNTKLSLLSNALSEEMASGNSRFIYKGKGVWIACFDVKKDKDIKIIFDSTVDSEKNIPNKHEQPVNDTDNLVDGLPVTTSQFMKSLEIISND